MQAGRHVGKRLFSVCVQVFHGGKCQRGPVCDLHNSHFLCTLVSLSAKGGRLLGPPGSFCFFFFFHFRLSCDSLTHFSISRSYYRERPRHCCIFKPGHSFETPIREENASLAKLATFHKVGHTGLLDAIAPRQLRCAFFRLIDVEVQSRPRVWTHPVNWMAFIFHCPDCWHRCFSMNALKLLINTLGMMKKQTSKCQITGALYLKALKWSHLIKS